MKTEKKMVEVEYRGMKLEISEEQFNDLREGWIRWSDLFD